MDIAGFVEYLQEQSVFAPLVNDPMAQFGQQNMPYLGAQFLPEQQQIVNEYTEDGISYRTVIANDGTRYSPVQIKKSTITGTMKVSLGNQDIGSEFTSKDYDSLVKLLRQSTGTAGIAGAGVDQPTMQAMSQIVQWADRTILRPLLERIELQRWQAIDNASVVRTGDDGYSETVGYPNPSGHRVGTGGTWSSDAYDPYAGDIIPLVEMLRGKGFTVNRIVTTQDVLSIMAKNAKMKAYVGRVEVVNNSVVNQSPGRATNQDLNLQFTQDGLPAIERYDRQYRTQNGTGYFKARGTMTLFCTTGRDAEIDRGDQEPLIMHDTLGYAGVGVPAGQSGPGRTISIQSFPSKPPRIEGEGWQTTLPVLQEPEAVAVITGIA